MKAIPIICLPQGPAVQNVAELSPAIPIPPGPGPGPGPCNGGGGGGGGCGYDPPGGGSGSNCINQNYNELPSPGWLPYFPHQERGGPAIPCPVTVATPD